MADLASPVIACVKAVGPTVWKYIKFQIDPNSSLTEFRSEKDKLHCRLNDVDSELQSQLRDIGKIPKREVDAWLKKGRNEIAKTDDDKWNKGGCFFNVCRAKHFADRSQELRRMLEEGGTWAQAGAVLVRVDHAVMKEHLESEFQKTYKNLQLRKKDVDSTLREQLVFGKIAKEEVDEWLGNVEEKLKTAQDKVSRGGSLSPPLLVELLERIIRELNYLLECGKEYIHAGVILVRVDHAIMKEHLESEFQKTYKNLQLRKKDVGSTLREQLVFGKIAKEEVDEWLGNVEEKLETAQDKVSQGGSLSPPLLVELLERIIRELNYLLECGKEYIHAGVILVRVDHAVMKEHLESEFQKTYKNLQLRKKDVGSILREQLVFGKIAKEEVDEWLGNVEEKLETAQDKVSQAGSLSPPLLVELLERIIRELNYLLECGEKCIHAGVILVRVDHAVMKEHLESEFQKTYNLQLRKKDVGSTLREQLSFGKIAKEEVDEWLGNVEEKLETAQDKVSQGGSLSPPLLVELLEGIIRELNYLLECGEKYIHAGVILVHDDPSTIRGVPLHAEKFYFRDTALAEIPKILKGDGVNRIAVWGMGGIGKTTLMKQIHNQFLNEAQFDKVIWITVSRTLDIRQIQDEIAQQVNKSQLKVKDATRRAGIVSALLQMGKYLLILDDVWEAFSDEDVGIPAESAGLKLVLTTRAADVARKMDCGEGEIIKLQPFSFEESLQLFRDKVGKPVGSIKPRLEATLMQIVEECDGLPLAIVTVASTMKGMSDDQYPWDMALKQLREGVSIVKGDKDPKSILKFSYDRLEDTKVQHCFLYCALYPEDFKIEKEQLIEYWIEERLIDEMDTRGKMICEGHEILRKLQDNCLLESIDDDKGAVKMHDLLRDMALDITSKSPRFFVKAGVSKEELQKKEPWPESVEKVSLMENKMEKIPLATTGLKYNMLTTLLMPGNLIIAISNSLFMQTPGLRILNLSWNWSLRRLPNSISDLKNLTTLLLGNCHRLKRVPSLSKCQALTKLDLENSGIKEVPDWMEMLVNLKYLNLRGTSIKLPEGMLPKLSNLQYLITRDVNIRVEDVITLRKLEYLEACLRHGRGLEEMGILLGFMQKQEQLTSYTHQVAAPSLTLELQDLEGSFTAQLHNDDGKLICRLKEADEERDLKYVNRNLQVQVHQALSLGKLVIKKTEKFRMCFWLWVQPTSNP